MEIVETLLSPVPPKEEHVAKTKESKEYDRLVDEIMDKGEKCSDGWEEAARRMNASLMVSLVSAIDKDFGVKKEEASEERTNTKPKEEK